MSISAASDSRFRGKGRRPRQAGRMYEKQLLLAIGIILLLLGLPEFFSSRADGMGVAAAIGWAALKALMWVGAVVGGLFLLIVLFALPDMIRQRRSRDRGAPDTNAAATPTAGEDPDENPSSDGGK